MEYKLLLLRFLHYTDAKMCLSGEELNNDGLGHTKHRINVRILLGWALIELALKVGSVAIGKSSFFLFWQPLLIEFIP